MSPVRRTVLALTVAFGMLGGAALAAPVAGPGDMSLGDPKAPVKVVEYASVSCGHCAHFNDEVFPAFKAKYIDTGKVHYTLKEFITSPPQVAAAGWLMARCAGPSKYFTVVDAMFKSQPRWQSEPIRDVLMSVGKTGGLSEAQVEACLADKTQIDALNARVKVAVEQDEVRATPTFFVNGKKAKEGVMSLEELDAAIAAAGK